MLSIFTPDGPRTTTAPLHNEARPDHNLLWHQEMGHVPVDELAALFAALPEPFAPCDQQCDRNIGRAFHRLLNQQLTSRSAPGTSSADIVCSPADAAHLRAVLAEDPGALGDWLEQQSARLPDVQAYLIVAMAVLLVRAFACAQMVTARAQRGLPGTCGASTFSPAYLRGLLRGLAGGALSMSPAEWRRAVQISEVWSGSIVLPDAAVSLT